MRPVSTRLLNTIRGSHHMSARARIPDSFQTGVEPTGTEIEVFNGDVTFDSDADVQASLDLLTDGEFSQNSILAPYGSEAFIERGVFFGDGSVEWVSLGYYRLDITNQDEVPVGKIRLTGKDRMVGIRDARLTEPREYISGTDYEEIIMDLVLDVYPDAEFDFDNAPGSLFISRKHIVERDRYAFIKELATARGKVVYFDHRGFFVSKDLPDVSTPVFTVDHGAYGVKISESREMSREQIYNGVVAFNDGADNNKPVRALIVNADPASKTYWYGPFGKIPRFFFSPFINTQVQAASAATKILKDALGLPYRIDLSMVPNPGLEVRDPIKITSLDEQDRIQSIRTLRIPLTADTPMTGTTKEKTTETIGEIE
jgi:Domain of unknown function (DUF5047)